MKRKRISPDSLLSLCGKIHPDDGIDPAEFFRPAQNRKRQDRKAQQLCRQVAHTLSLVLGSDFGDELHDVQVIAVTPAPDTSQLLVAVAPINPSDRVNADTVLSRLNAIAGQLRTEVASAITRRRAPKLLFQFIAQPNDEGVNS